MLSGMVMIYLPIERNGGTQRSGHRYQPDRNRILDLIHIKHSWSPANRIILAIPLIY
jgi:hypothetical protein